MLDPETQLKALGWRSNWLSRVDSSTAISSLSDYASLELQPNDAKNGLHIMLVAWPDPSHVHVELFGVDGAHVELTKLRDVLVIGEAIFRSRFEDRQ
jgi:hypothetical protein